MSRRLFHIIQRPASTMAYASTSTPQKMAGTNIGTIRHLSSNPLDAFRDQVDRQTRGSEPVGRPWSVKELRRKSYEDLHKLWYVLYKERNMLLTEQQLSRRRQLIFPQPERFKKVQKSMGAIKQVLGERKREKIAAFKSKMEEEMLANIEDDVSIEIDPKSS